MYLRLAAFLNPGGKAGHTLIALPNLSDRARMDFVVVPTLDRMMTKLKTSEDDIITSIIICIC